MNFEDLQQAWQQDAKNAPLPEVNEALVRSVQANSRKFTRSIFWRDLREVAASFFVAFIFGRIAWAAQAEGTPAWPAWVAAALPLGVAAFFLTDRWVSARRHAPQGDDVLAEIDRAIDAVKHQISLLRNVFWWYILPIGLSVGFLALQIVLYMPTELPPHIALAVKVGLGLLVVVPAWAFDWWVWKINQKAIRVNLAPELAELETRRQEITGEA